jgi:hypothetical protein
MASPSNVVDTDSFEQWRLKFNTIKDCIDTITVTDIPNLQTQIDVVNNTTIPDLQTQVTKARFLDIQFEQDEVNTSGITFGVSAGKLRIGSGVIEFAATQQVLVDDTDNTIYVNTANGFEAVESSTTALAPTEDIIPLFNVTTLGGTISSIEDVRTWATVTEINIAPLYDFFHVTTSQNVFTLSNISNASDVAVYQNGSRQYPPLDYTVTGQQEITLGVSAVFDDRVLVVKNEVDATPVPIIPTANTTTSGVVELGTTAEHLALVSNDVVCTPGRLPIGSETQRGLAQKASQLDVDTGLDDTKFVTSSQIENKAIVDNNTYLRNSVPDQVYGNSTDTNTDYRIFFLKNIILQPTDDDPLGLIDLGNSVHWITVPSDVSAIDISGNFRISDLTTTIVSAQTSMQINHLDSLGVSKGVYRFVNAHVKPTNGTLIPGQFQGSLYFDMYKIPVVAGDRFIATINYIPNDVGQVTGSFFWGGVNLKLGVHK